MPLSLHSSSVLRALPPKHLRLPRVLQSLHNRLKTLWGLNLEVSLRYFMGDQVINNILYPPPPPLQPSIVLYANSYCDTGCGSSESIIICRIGHKFCINCLGSWVQTLVPPDVQISCPIQACPEPINTKNLTDALGKLTCYILSKRNCGRLGCN